MEEQLENRCRILYDTTPALDGYGLEHIVPGVA